MIDPIEQYINNIEIEQMFAYAYLYSQARDGVIRDTYVQDENYFSTYSEEIKELFGAGIGYLPCVGVHVRRGDYLTNNFHRNLSVTNYYDRAMALFPGESFVIVSDDREWCKSKFQGDKIQVFEAVVKQMKNNYEKANAMSILIHLSRSSKKPQEMNYWVTNKTI